MAEMSRESRAMLLNVLWHHQGGSSPVGQPLRKLLGIEQHAHLTKEQLGEAKWIDGLLARGTTSRTYAALQANKGKPEPPDRRIPGNGDGAFAGSKITRLAEFCAEGERLGVTGFDLAEALKDRPEFADCKPNAGVNLASPASPKPNTPEQAKEPK